MKNTLKQTILLIFVVSLLALALAGCTSDSSGNSGRDSSGVNGNSDPNIGEQGGLRVDWVYGLSEVFTKVPADKGGDELTDEEAKALFQNLYQQAAWSYECLNGNNFVYNPEELTGEGQDVKAQLEYYSSKAQFIALHENVYSKAFCEQHVLPLFEGGEEAVLQEQDEKLYFLLAKSDGFAPELYNIEDITFITRDAETIQLTLFDVNRDAVDHQYRFTMVQQDGNWVFDEFATIIEQE